MSHVETDFHASRLFRLSDLSDYEVADGDPDVRGWKVVGSDGMKLGEVEELIVDPEILKVRYLEVDAESELFSGHVLLPIGLAAVDADDKLIFIASLNAAVIRNYPRYVGEAITRDYEMSLRDALLREYAASGVEPLDVADPSAAPISSIRRRKISATAEHVRLDRLADLKDYQMANDEVDVRGWEVIDSNGKKLGKVEDLIVDPEQMKIRYLEISTGTIGKRHFLLPIGVATIDEVLRKLVLTATDSAGVRRIPSYRGGPITRDYELAVRKALFPDMPADATADFYDTGHFDEDSFYRQRPKSIEGRRIFLQRIQ
jgi:photosynthetic reaction center H subunit